MGKGGFRIASVRVFSPRPGGEIRAGTSGEAGEAGRAGAGEAGRRLGVALLAASPRVSVVGPGLCRADARGWGRRGGEEALARALLGAAAAGFSGARVGVADSAVAADAAAALAASGPLVVPPGRARAFLAPLPLDFLPVPEGLRATLRALGFRGIGEVADLRRSELEARFGPAGIRAHRWATGEDDRAFRPLSPEEPPEARLELDGPVEELEPLLFVLRHLLARVCADLAGEGRGAARLDLELLPELLSEGASGDPGIRGPGHRDPCAGLRAPSAGRRPPPAPRRIPVVPARPTAREDLLFDLCRAALERAVAREPVAGLALRVRRTAPAAARQGNLFERGWRDPLAAAGALSRLRARLGEEGVVRPAPRPSHRPEGRNRWAPAEDSDGRRAAGPAGYAATVPIAGEGAAGGPGDADPDDGDPDDAGSGGAVRGGAGAGAPLPPVLRLLPRPVPVWVRTAGGCPTTVWERRGRSEVVAAEGPERLSGEWWGKPYRREYYRAYTSRGELLWLFRERRGGRWRWWLHGWWD